MHISVTGAIQLAFDFSNFKPAQSTQEILPLPSILHPYQSIMMVVREPLVQLILGFALPCRISYISSLPLADGRPPQCDNPFC